MKKTALALILIMTLLCSTVFVSAADDPSVAVINPESSSTVYADNLLISLKITEPKTIRVIVYEEKELFEDGSMGSLSTLESMEDVDIDTLRHVVVSPAEDFTSTNNLSFYTKQLSDVTPGLYMIRILTMDGEEAIYATDSYVLVRDPAEAKAVVFESQQSGVLNFLQNFLKNIFGS